MTTPLLSIIIPAHNEENRLPPSLLALSNFLSRQEYSSEILVVENGSKDRTFEIAQSFLKEIPDLKVIREQNAGKGLAVRRGMLAAEGQYRIFCDADFSMPVEEIQKFLPPKIDHYDVAIASRELAGAKRIGEPEYRHRIGRIFNSMVRWSVLPGLHDTQCGFKAFRADVAEIVFQQQTLPGWSFDAEVLVIARERGYHIEEIPIIWYYKPGTRLHFIKDSIQMAVDLLTIRRNAKRGLYGTQQSHP
jgi:glycosyltransferase involved in cell wall biosynthesis